MIRIQINSDAMKRASQHAMAKPLKVKMTEFRSYEVINGEGRRYVVRFSVNAKGSKFAECTCEAGWAGLLCYHVAGALPMVVLQM